MNAAVATAVAVGSLLVCGAAQATAIGEVAADFARVDLSGRQVKLSDFRGKVVLLNFWATWCVPCREELPVLSKWQREYRTKGLRVIGVSMDDDAGSVTHMLAQRPVSYPVIMGDAKLGERFGGVLGLPLSYLLDAQGRVIARFQGEADLPGMRKMIRKALSHQSAAALSR